MNPYWGASFFEFFSILLKRLFTLNGPAMADEIQLLVLSGIAISCGVIGPFLVLRRMTLFANSLSHTILIGIAGAYFFTAKAWGAQMFDLSTLLIGALIAAVVTAFFTDALIRFFRLQEDASIGLVFTVLFALGIAFVTFYTRDLHLSVEAVMGNVDVLQMSDLHISLALALFNTATIVLFYKQFQVVSFDRSLAQILRVRYGLFHFALLFLTSMTCIAAFRAIGVILVIAFLVGPYLTARLFCHRLPWLLFWTPIFGISASLFGVAFSRHILSFYGLALSTGGSVVCFVGVLYIVARICVKYKKNGEIEREEDSSRALLNEAAK